MSFGTWRFKSSLAHHRKYPALGRVFSMWIGRNIWRADLLGYNNAMRMWYELLLFSVLRKHKRLTNLSQEKFEAFCAKNSNNRRLTMLSLAGSRGLNTQDLSSLKQIPNLQELFVEDAITQANLEQIATCSNLKVLCIDHAGKLDTISPIAQLSNLEALTITTPVGWVAKLKTLPDISALQSLSRLRYLNLAGIKIEKHGLEPLKGLACLKKVLVISDYRDELSSLLGRSSR